MDLHLNYEEAKPFALKRTDLECAGTTALLIGETCLADGKRRRAAALQNNEKPKLKPKLKADKAAGVIEIDAETMLSGMGGRRLGGR